MLLGVARQQVLVYCLDSCHDARDKSANKQQPEPSSGSDGASFSACAVVFSCVRSSLLLEVTFLTELKMIPDTALSAFPL